MLSSAHGLLVSPSSRAREVLYTRQCTTRARCCICRRNERLASVKRDQGGLGQPAIATTCSLPLPPAWRHTQRWRRAPVRHLFTEHMSQSTFLHRSAQN